MDIRNTLWKFNKSQLPESFVSVAVKITDKKPVHAAILIRHKKINHLHHFPGNVPPILEENFSEDGWYIYKILTSFQVDDEDEIGSVLQQCKRICAKSTITYSFTIDGSYYTNTGDFVSPSGLPELGTCVGFCFNTLNSIILESNNSLLQLDDWDDSGIAVTPWDHWSLNKVAKRFPNLDWTLYNAFRKRITPLEYLCASFLEDYPIRKTSIDAMKPSVLRSLGNLV